MRYHQHHVCRCGPAGETFLDGSNTMLYSAGMGFQAAPETYDLTEVFERGAQDVSYHRRALSFFCHPNGLSGLSSCDCGIPDIEVLRDNQESVASLSAAI